MDTTAPQATNLLSSIEQLVDRARDERPGGLVSRHGYAVGRGTDQHYLLLRNGELLAEVNRPGFPPHRFYEVPGDSSRSDTRAANSFLRLLEAGVDVDELRRQAKAQQSYDRRIARLRRSGSADAADRLSVEALIELAAPAAAADPLDASPELEPNDALDSNAPDPLADPDRTGGESSVWSKCRICGQPLHTAKSRARGIGDECLGKAA